MSLLTPPPPIGSLRRDPSVGFDDPEWSARTGYRMSLEEFARLPDSPDLTRYLVDGEVWEYPVTVRSRPHSTCEARAAAKLVPWLDEAWPGGEVASGEAAVQLPGRETRLGADVVVFDAETVAAQPPPPGKDEGMYVWHGTPRLVVEIVSFTDRAGDVAGKVSEYLAAGVPRIWVADPMLKTLTVHRPDAPAETFQGDRVLEHDAALPGLRVRAGDLFG